MPTNKVRVQVTLLLPQCTIDRLNKAQRRIPCSRSRLLSLVLRSLTAAELGELADRGADIDVLGVG